ncbi:MAG TPA: hypothetical protein VG347_12520 [Verrucomicrobiae bacterium]|nr:hypothetical protein [Verrucomicrobiae bacterium]
MEKGRALLFEDNIISMRTAVVGDDGGVVHLRLLPAWSSSSIPGVKPRPLNVMEDGTNLYRHLLTPGEEQKLMSRFAPVEQALKPMAFKSPPVFELVWADSGNGLVLYLNQEPWAFIDENTHKAYSKGVLKPAGGNPWDQKLYEQLFGAT